MRMETLFLSISFSVDRDLITNSDVAIFFSKSKSFLETDKNSPKAYEKFYLVIGHKLNDPL